MKFRIPNSIKIQLILLGLALASVPGIFAQEVSLQASLDSTKALMGDQLTLSLKVDQAASSHILFPVFGDTLTGGIEILRKSAIDTSRTPDGKTSLRQDLLITVFDTGDFEIPPIPFIVQNGNNFDTLHTVPVAFTIMPMQADSTIRDIKGNMKAPVTAAELLPWIIALVILAALGYLVWRLIRNRQKRGPHTVLDRPADPPDVTALRLLEQMREEKPWLHMPVKSYYISLTEVLRVYIHGRFGVLALEQTTDEILVSLKGAGCDAGAMNRLKSVLRLSDLVKFAKVVPDEIENTQQVNEAVEFVKATSFHGNPPGEESRAVIYEGKGAV
jgi:hypothetical protein